MLIQTTTIHGMISPLVKDLAADLAACLRAKTVTDEYTRRLARVLVNITEATGRPTTEIVDASSDLTRFARVAAKSLRDSPLTEVEVMRLLADRRRFQMVRLGLLRLAGQTRPVDGMPRWLDAFNRANCLGTKRLTLPSKGEIWNFGHGAGRVVTVEEAAEGLLAANYLPLGAHFCAGRPTAFLGNFPYVPPWPAGIELFVAARVNSPALLT